MTEPFSPENHRFAASRYFEDFKLGERFVLAYTAVKESEYDTFLRVISSWEREHLLLNV